MQYDAGVPDDLIAVPTGELRRLEESYRRVSALVLALWALFIVLAVALARKSVITWPDLVAVVGWHG